MTDNDTEKPPNNKPQAAVQPAAPASSPDAPLSAAEIAAESVRLEEARRSGGARAVGRSIIGVALIISLATLLSRFLGLAREVFTAHLFGPSREMDAFFMAFLVPNLFRRLFGEGALSSATIPVLARYKRQGDPAATRRLVGTISTTVALGLTVAAAITIAVCWIIPPGAIGEAEKFVAFRLYLTILLPYVVFICITGLQAGVLQSYGVFGLPSLTPALANVVWIGVLGALWLTRLPATDAPAAVAWMAAGALLSGIVQWAAQLPSMRKVGLLVKPTLDFKEPGVRQTFAAMGPMLFALAVFQVNTFFDQVMAEMFVPGHGAVSVYAYAQRLFQLPLGLVSIALATAIFPLMSRFAAAGELPKLTASVVNSQRLLAFISLPAAAGLCALSYPITALLFAGPQYPQDMIQRTALVVAALSLSLPFVSAVGLVTKAFYALRDNKTPTRIALATVAINLVCNFIFVQTTLREAGLAVGTGVSTLFNLVLLAVMLRKRLRGGVLESGRVESSPQASERIAQPLTSSKVKSMPLGVLRSLVAALVMAGGAFAVEYALFGAFGLTGRTGRLISVSVAIIAGVVIYAGLSMALRAPEFEQIMALRKRHSSSSPTP
ncbi:MAG: murein biosynthesis integral membrane protein MurJ [Planctomycetes bacterium]|nr:murein biosynthesis integral membrane protein MurJ [Planctomycetota bacterium]